jgi:hypothetical protein
MQTLKGTYQTEYHVYAVMQRSNHPMIARTRCKINGKACTYSLESVCKSHLIMV